MGLACNFTNVRESPAFVYCAEAMKTALDDLAIIGRASGCKILFALKSLSLEPALDDMAEAIDGFAASSLFEATLARKVIGTRGSVHITTPGFRADEIDSIAEKCDYVSFNSLTQLAAFQEALSGCASIGLRVNPQLSFVGDKRYDPCRPSSKLGVPLDDLASVIDGDFSRLRSVRGVLVHSNCDATTLAPLVATVRQIELRAEPLLHRLEWINLGGGYLFSDATDRDAFFETVQKLKSRYGITVFIEPGAMIARPAVSLVASVLDIFESDSKIIAVLDTTVNHLPEVFEYQYEPEISAHVEGGAFSYIVAGSTCLAGDIFGEYTFDAPLEVGSRVVFPNVGAYSLVKAHMFNGVNLP